MTNKRAVNDFCIHVIQPRTIYNCPYIAKMLREENYVVLDLRGATADEAQRIIDFTTGVASYACAKIQKMRGGGCIYINYPKELSCFGACI